MRQEYIRCVVCDADIPFIGAEAFDDRYGEPNIYRLSCCSNCSHISTMPRLQESDLPQLYGTYYPRKSLAVNDVVIEASKVTRPFAGLTRWWNGTDNQGQYQVRSGETMLDVGCGSGTSLVEAKALGAKAFGIETDPNVRPIATLLNLSIHFGSVHDRPFSNETFDLIVMNQVIEHLPEPDLAFKALRERLKPGGRMVVVFPNRASLWRSLSGSRWINWHIPYHQHHFELSTFERMAQNCGLKIKFHRTITPNVWTLLQIRALRYRPQRGKCSPIWIVRHSASAMKVRGKKTRYLRTFSAVAARSICALLNRVVDALGKGDSILVELRRDE